ncbi:MAG: ATP-grasp domain-containing protein [Candidatus Rokuibacteriota bacterium]
MASPGAAERPAKVLVLDANQRSALAVTRSLGRRGIPVVAGDETKATLAGASRYCSDTLVYPSPSLSPDDFVRTLEREVARRGIAVVVPLTDVTVQQVLSHCARLPGVTIPCATPAAFDAVTDKWHLYALARRLGVPMPATYLARTPRELRAAASELGFPLVLKPRRSRVLSNGRWIAPPVMSVASAAELSRAWAAVAVPEDDGSLVQAYVSGRGQGVFALYGHGRALTFFAHRRLREKPPWGGVSVLSESVAPDPELRGLGQRLLDAVGWHGVAMVEFKVSGDGTPYLLEVNGRFWGSLQLAIDAGVDFPWLLYRLAHGDTVEPTPHYAVGVRNRWLLGDLDHLYLTLRTPGTWRQKARAVRQFLRLFERGTRHEVDRWDDLRPCLLELRQYVFGARGSRRAGHEAAR